MLEVARPAFFWAGLLLAGLPLALHFFRPRERTPRALPTVRFLTEDSRIRIRPARRPDQLLLLALRMALCLAVGGAFARASWVGPSRGVGYLVVVDASPAMAPFWEAAREAALEELPEGPLTLTLVRPGADGFPRVERPEPEVLFDGEVWGSLRPSEGPGVGAVRLAHLIRAVRDAGGWATGVDSLGARIVSVPGWTAWGPGVAQLREELWSARIDLRVPGSSAGAASDPEIAPRPPAPIVQVIAQGGVLEPILDALGALGAEPVPDSATLGRVILVVGAADLPPELWEGGRDEVSPSSDDRTDASGGDFLLLDGRTVPGAGPRVGGTPAAGVTVPVLRAGGIPAAGASRLDGGRCHLVLPLHDRAPILASGELVLVLESLLHEGCGIHFGAMATGPPPGAVEPGPAGPGPERTGALAAWQALLAGEERPALLEAAPLRAPEAGLPLTRLLLAVALGLALLESMRRRHVDRISGLEKAGSSDRRRPRGER